MITLNKNSVSIIFVWVVLTFCSFDGNAQPVLNNPFFAMNNCVRGGPYNTPAKETALLNALGYDGMEGYNVFRKNGIENLKELLNALDKDNLRLYTIYIHINLDNTEHPYDTRLKKVFSLLQGRGTMPWFMIKSDKYKPSSAKGDSLAIPMLQEIADMAHRYGLKVMIYPHVGTWVGSVEDAIQVARKVNRRNLGFTFNLVHYLSFRGTKAEKYLRPLVDKAMPYLFAISLNGADKPTKRIMNHPKTMFNHFIKPLGEGNYDVLGYLMTFIDRGFKGPVGLQCYGIKGSDKQNLKYSMNTWNKYNKKIEKINNNE